MFQKQHSSIVIDVKDYVIKVIFFARTLRDKERIKTYKFINLIVAASDWNYYSNWTKIDVLQLTKSVINSFSLEDRLASLILEF